MNHFDQTLANIRAAQREGNLEKELYYLQGAEKMSCPPFEEFQKSSSYSKWIGGKRTQDQLKEMAQERMAAVEN
jgi:hypothetical protein